MGYNTPKGPQQTGDIKFESDPDDTQIDFADDYISLKTHGQARLTVQGTAGNVGIGTTVPSHNLTIMGATSGSSTLEIVGQTTLGDTLSVSGSCTLASDVSMTAGNLMVSGSSYLGSAPEHVSVITGTLDMRGTGLLGPVFISGSAMAVGTGSPAPSTILHLQSQVGAFLPPRLNTTQRDALTATAGMIVYNTSTNKLQCYDGTSWQDCF